MENQPGGLDDSDGGAVTASDVATEDAPGPIADDAARTTGRDGSPRLSRGFVIGLVLICVLGAGIRLGYVAFFKQDATDCSTASFLERGHFPRVSPVEPGYTAPDNICGDAGYYHLGANLLADGHGYIVPFRYLFEERGAYQAADHPPLYMTYLAAFSAVGLRSVLDHQLASVALGLTSIALIGLAARRLAGERVGLIAAFLGAVYIYIWVNDGLVMSETLAITLTAALFLCTFRYQARPTWGRLVPLGVVAGLAALTRAELVMYLVLVVPLAVWQASDRRWKPALLRSGAVVAVAGLVMAPWLVRNLATFERPVSVSTNLGITLKYTNCDSTYYGSIRGYWDFGCLGDVPSGGDQSLDEIALRKAGLDYVKDNLSAVPRVVATRVLRQWNLYKPTQQVFLDELIEDREQPLNRVALGQYYVLTGLAVAGAVVLIRRRGFLVAWTVLSVYAIVTITAMVTYGTTRFRAPAEVATVMLAAVVIDAAIVGVGRLWARRQAGQPPLGSL